MKKVVIGRGRECNVVLADTTDVVSRRQAVIAFTFWGKMTLYDTSSNGTFVNGQRLAKQEGKVVTRRDKINFGHVWDLDWATIKDPYRNTKLALAGLLVALLLVAGALFLFLPDGKGGEPENKGVVTDTLRTDTLHQNTPSAEPQAETAEPPMQQENRGGAVKQRKNTKGSRSYEVADSAWVEDDVPVDSTASVKSNEAPLIY